MTQFIGRPALQDRGDFGHTCSLELLSFVDDRGRQLLKSGDLRTFAVEYPEHIDRFDAELDAYCYTHAIITVCRRPKRTRPE